jgi:hypothetical protein
LQLLESVQGHRSYEMNAANGSVIARFKRRAFASRQGAPATRLAVGTMLLALLSFCFCGCQSVSMTGTSSTPTTPQNPDATGNWQITFKASGGSTLFPDATGFIMENITDTGTTKFLTAELTATSTAGCFQGTNAIFGTGAVSGTGLTINSASINGQYINIASTLDATSTHFTGTYAVTGGCATGASGAVSAVQFAALTGTYSGTVTGSSPAQTIKLQLTQNGQGNGNGEFQVVGSVAVTGFSCFQSGSLSSGSGFVTGASAQLNFDTNDLTGAQLDLVGTFDPAADTVTLTSINVSSGACAGSFGTATLTRGP